MNKLTNFEDFLSLLGNVTENADGYMALCPAHNDTKPSLSVKQAENGRVLLHCFAGCSFENILIAMDVDPDNPLLTGRTLKENTTEATNSGKGNYGVIVPESNPKSSEPAQVKGVTVSEIAAVKKLPVEFLNAIGVSDWKYQGKARVRIQYKNAGGEVVATRYRLTLTNESSIPRFIWQKGSNIMPYGLDQLEKMRRHGWVLLVEGESDSWTMWYHNLPAIGIPGKTTWQPEWADYFKGLDVYLWQEPDAEDLAKNVFENIPDLKVIVAPDGVKDISEAHIQGKPIPAYIEELKTKAIAAKDIQADINGKELKRLYNEAKPVIESADPLVIITAGIKKRYGGDTKPALIAYLSATTRVLEPRDGSMPVHYLLHGPASCGKTFAVSVVKKLLPTNAYYEVDAGTPRMLVYDREPIKHKVIFLGETDSLPKNEDNSAASALRSLLQNGVMSYKATERDPETGRNEVRTIIKEGPAVLITTGTEDVGHQLATRMFIMEVRDDKEQIDAALKAQARIEINGVIPPPQDLIAFQSYLQLQAPILAVVPFAEGLSDALSYYSLSTPPILRDFTRLMSMTKAVAILRQFHRKRDDRSRIIAELQDYETVRGLVNDIYIDTTGASKEIRDLVEAVSSVLNGIPLGEYGKPTEKVTGSKLATHLNISRMAVSRRARKAIEMGWLVNNESRKGTSADYGIGEPLPTDFGLPTSLNIQYQLEQDHNTADDTLLSLENTDHNALTPVSKNDDIVTDDSLDINPTQ